MPAQGTLLKRLARALPDIPRWVEVREMLLDGTAEVVDLHEQPELSFVAVDRVSGFIGIVGRPPPEPIVEAAELSACRDQAVCEVRAYSHVAGALPGWKSEEAPLCLLADGASLSEIPRASVRLLTKSEIAFLEGVSPDLQEEFRSAVECSPLAATILDGTPVSFCYAGALTETLWDISVDTLEAYRGRGFAAPCIAYMVALMRERKKEPMWSALESNRASRRLAAKLGFVEVDRMSVFLPPSGTA